MKNRFGFVSNSSSTSFMVAIDENSNTNAKIEIDFDLRSFVEDEIGNQKQLDEWFKNRYGYIPNGDDRESEEDSKFYAKCLVAIENGKRILAGSLSWNGGVSGILAESNLEGYDFKGVEVLEQCR